MSRSNPSKARPPSKEPTYFETMYSCARLWEKTEKNNPEKVKDLFGNGGVPQCFACANACVDPATKEFKARVCSGCKGVVYCSPECQRADWKKSMREGSSPHKGLCAQTRKFLEQASYFRSQFTQFPWYRIEPDGNCLIDIIKARLGVLGSGPSFGYWSTRGSSRQNDKAAVRTPASRNAMFDAIAKIQQPAEEYTHGEVLLRKSWPTNVEAWHLKDDKHVPRLLFTADSPPPPKVQPGEINDWRSWYDWRGLSLASPAALLMNYPLSVYYLLVDTLKVVDPESTPENRQALIIHYIGVEIELNFLPLFSELALLLPNTDITFIIFGKPAYDLFHSARQTHLGSLVTNDIIWSYTAPQQSGGGSISIKIYTKSDTWTRSVVTNNKPDVLIGLNAGVTTYSEWTDPVCFSAILDIPFGITDYSERLTTDHAEFIPRICANQVRLLGGPECREFEALMKPRTYSATRNPFHRPGQQGMASMLIPTYINGFAMSVVTKN